MGAGVACYADQESAATLHSTASFEKMLTTGIRLGPYEITARIGQGGMGEVYGARDTRLEREVAIKVLPFAMARDPDRLRRFEREARIAGSLNHPHVLVVYDIGMHEGAPYLVSERLEGADLRHRLADGPLQPSRAIELAVQIASGLAAAHARGVVHRDIKPENLFLTRDGHIKILDFGLARREGDAPGVDDATRTMPPADRTEPGLVLGTAGYMSPEQVMGHAVDHRSDIFSFGVVLYEMLSGRRAFHRDSLAETMSAVLREEPPSLLASNASLSPTLDRLIGHCLRKRPEDRFQLARDLALSLDTCAAATAPGRVPPATSAAPRFRKITFRRGNLLHARFTPDGQTVVYSAAWDGRPAELYMSRIDGRESRQLGVSGADLLSISASGDLAILLKKNHLMSVVGVGTLARVPIGGGSPRALLDDVFLADWGGDELAVLAPAPSGSASQIEFPAGRVLCRPGQFGPIRVSPDGRYVAVIQEVRANQDSLLIVDRSGADRVLVQGAGPLRSLAWAPGGDEILFTRKPSPNETAMCAVTLDGHMREIYRTDGSVTLCDVSRDARLLLQREVNRLEMRCFGPEHEDERDLSWLDGSAVAALSEDGSVIAFREMRGGGGPRGGMYLRRTDGSEPVWLGEGYTCDLSADGKWVMTLDMHDPPAIVLLPTGTGRPRTVPTGGLHPWGGGFVDGERIAFGASGADGHVRFYVIPVRGGEPRTITEDPVVMGTAVSPDGRFIAFATSDNRTRLYPVDGGEPTLLQGAEPGEVPVQWSEDGRWVYVRRFGELPVAVDRLDIHTGERERWRTVMPADAAGVIGIPHLVLTRNGRFHAYTCARVVSSELVVAEGLL